MLKHLNQPIVFCDVETTGSAARNSRITEIACIRYEKGVETNRLVTLVNPQRPIPYNIQNITGITNQMVVCSPTFSEIAHDVDAIFKDAILCAHNARFDLSFIKTELSRANIDFKPDVLCTVQLSRKLFPEHRSHSLSNIIKRHNFDCNARHRALGDTEVLVQFSKFIDRNFSTSVINKAINVKKTLSNLPPNLNQAVINNLPEQPGVYEFIGKDSEVLYIGKSVNIKKRVKSHFSAALRDSKSKKIWGEVVNINYYETASDLGAQLLELHKIKTELPIYNRKSRRLRKLWYLKKHHSDSNYLQLEVKSSFGLESDELDSVYGVFRTKKKATDYLQTLVKQHGLCSKFLGLEKTTGQCFSSQLGICKGACTGRLPSIVYNSLSEAVLKSRKVKTWPHNSKKEIILNNSNNNHCDRIVVDNWILQSAETIDNTDTTHPLFNNEVPTFDYEMYKVLAKYL